MIIEIYVGPDGKPLRRIKVQATPVGPWLAVHRARYLLVGQDISSAGWTVTHVNTGLGFPRDQPTKAAALRCAERMAKECGRLLDFSEPPSKARVARLKRHWLAVLEAEASA